MEYEQLAVSLRDVLQKDPNAFSASSLLTIDSVKLQSWFPTHTLPNIDERVSRLQELGFVLDRDYQGLASNLVAQCKGSAVELVRIVIEKLQGFRDTIIYKGKLIHFYKRAQILCGDLWAAYGRKTTQTDPTHYSSFDDMHRLTMFADYRVPQILRHVGIMVYSDSLAAAIDSKQEIPYGSNEETEIRAATVIAVDELQQALADRGVSVLVIEVDWLLWNKGETELATLMPHHRTLTIYY